jgi:hypothetical protein
MTKDELFEIFDKYDTYTFSEKGESIHSIKWADLNGLADELVKLFDTPVVSKSLPLPAERWDAEELLNSKDVFNHPRVETRLNDDSFEVADLMVEFANKYYGNVL